MNKKIFSKISILLICFTVLFLAGCQGAETEEENSEQTGEVAETKQGEEAETSSESGITEEENEIEPDLKVGGTLVIALDIDLPTLDPTYAVTDKGPMQHLGASLVAKSPDSNQYVPYAAESWAISEDGLDMIFTLKTNILFHDGTPCTANDFAWTYNRAKDPDTGATVVGSLLENLDYAEAIDDYTLRLRLLEPNFPFMESVSLEGYMQPLQQALVEEYGDELSQHFVGIGPYMLKEWQTGNKIVLERNPDFDWGPLYGQDAFNIQYLEYRILPEYATIVSGLQSGDIQFASINTIDLEIFEGDSNFNILKSYHPGTNPVITMDVSQPPFDDVLVRQAVNYAIDRQSLIDTSVLGNGIIQYGPLSPAQIGYSDTVESIGYTYDPEKAKSLLEEAGYVMNEDGIFEKEGVPLALTLRTYVKLVKDAEIVQQQLREIGIDITLQQDLEQTLDADWFVGNSQFTMGSIEYSEADILYLLYHSNFLGVLNYGNVNDPVLDEILNRTRTEIDGEARQEAVTEAQEYIVEQAYIAPLYVPMKYFVLSSNVKNYIWTTTRGGLLNLLLNNAYLEE